MKYTKRILLALLALCLLLLSSCGLLQRRERGGNMEFIYQAETDTYTLAYYTDTTQVTQLTVPDTFKDKKVTAIGRLAISSCESLVKVVIGENIAEIDRWGIVDCRYLKAIEVAPGNPSFCSVDGVLYSKDMKKLVTYPNAHTAEYADSGTLLKKASYTVLPGTKIIGHCAFYKCYGLEKVLLPDSVEVIEERAFHKCDALADIDFPEGLVSIGKDAFLGCTGFQAVTLPSTLREIGEYAFYNAMNVKSIHIKANQTDVALGNKWFPTSAGRSIPDVAITWGAQ